MNSLKKHKKMPQLRFPVSGLNYLIPVEMTDLIKMGTGKLAYLISNSLGFLIVYFFHLDPSFLKKFEEGVRIEVAAGIWKPIEEAGPHGVAEKAGQSGAAAKAGPSGVAEKVGPSGVAEEAGPMRGGAGRGRGKEVVRTSGRIAGEKQWTDEKIRLLICTFRVHKERFNCSKKFVVWDDMSIYKYI